MPNVQDQHLGHPRLLKINHHLTAHLGHFVALFCRTLCFAGWITQSKNDGPFVEGSHIFENLFCESTTNCSNS